MLRIISKRVYWFLLALVAFLFAWNDQSLWMDECCMVMCAAQNTVCDIWAKVTEIGGSDTQMPFYLYLLHIWIKLTGADTEMSLRLYNVIWVLLAAWFLRREPKVLLILFISPFFIYYTNELRPYIMQIAASCGVSMFLYKRGMGEQQSFVRGFGLLFLLCSTSLTSVIWAFGFLLAWAVLEGRNFWSRRLGKAVAYWFIPFCVLGSYYSYTLLLGARATHIKSSALVNIGASVYELFGLTGLGPARSELRLCTQVSDVFGHTGLLVALFAGLIVGGLVLWGGYMWKTRTSNAQLFSLGILLVVPSLVFIVSSLTMDFRFSGRHFAPVLPLICIAISMGVKWSKEKPFWSVLSTAFVFIWLVSDIYIRFDDTYAREDFRGAIEYCKARKEEGNSVLLLCNGAGKVYYGWDDDVEPDNWRKCQTIVVSRPDDYAGIIKKIEQSGHYHKKRLCPAFWEYTLK